MKANDAAVSEGKGLDRFPGTLPWVAALLRSCALGLDVWLNWIARSDFVLALHVIVMVFFFLNFY